MFASVASATVLLSCGPGSDATSGIVVDGDDNGGVVTSADGPEARAWVIAETDDLGTRCARIVVTDDRGRYLVPDLPEAGYRIWVRGYGLVDSERGELLDLHASVAPDAAAATHVKPHRICDSERDELVVDEGMCAIEQIACCDRHVLSEVGSRKVA